MTFFPELPETRDRVVRRLLPFADDNTRLRATTALVATDVLRGVPERRHVRFAFVDLGYITQPADQSWKAGVR